MFKRFLLSCITVVLLTSTNVMITAEAATTAPSNAAEAACLIDADTGDVLYTKNPTKWMHPASTTKIMTTIVALEDGKDKLDRPLLISQEAADTEESDLGISPTDKVTLREALTGMMVVSGNDAAVAVAQTVGGSVWRFSRMMTEKAQKIGAVHTSFKNPNGLTTAKHYTTAVDMAKIAAYGMKIPEFRRIVGLTSYDMKYIDNRPTKHVVTTNHFLESGYDGANGIKTGYTDAAGCCLIASATQNGKTLIVVLFNDDNRWDDAPALLDYGFAKIEQTKKEK